MPSVGLIFLHREQIPSLFLSQCLVRDSTLARPDKALACITAFDNSYGEDPQVRKMGWVRERDIKFGLKYLRDLSLRKNAWPRSFFSQ